MNTALWSQLIGSLLFPLVALFMLELGFGMLPLAGSHLAKLPRWFRQKYVFILFWPFKFFLKLAEKYGGKILTAAWRGLIIALKRLFAAAWRGVKIVAGRTRSRIRGTP